VSHKEALAFDGPKRETKKKRAKKSATTTFRQRGEKKMKRDRTTPESLATVGKERGRERPKSEINLGGTERPLKKEAAHGLALPH